MNETLFSEFAEVSKETWRELILKDLKGANFEKVQWDTEEGFTLEPFYTKEDLGDLPQVPRNQSSWKITDEILSPSEINPSLAGGADALYIVSHKEGKETYGLSIGTNEELIKELEEIPKEIPIILSLANRTPDFAEGLRKLNDSHNHVYTDYDPYGTLLLCGELGSKKEDLNSNFAKLVNSKGIHSIAVHGYYLRDAGATIGQELAFSLSWGVDYLNRLLDLGLSLKEANDSLWFFMGVGSNYFFEIAKLSAHRILWAEILNAYEPGFGDENPTTIFSRTSEFQYTAYDPYVNMLRGTTAAMSAVLGGSDFVQVLPFDHNYSEKQELGKRIARNSQLLLRSESFFDKVEDPSKGSYYLETLTKNLITSVWEKFQTLEKDGGFFAGIQSGKVQDEIGATASKKRSALASKKEILLGTNQYPLPTERHPELSTSLEHTKKLLEFGSPTEYKRITPLRLSYEFDRLRQLTDEQIASGKKAPKVFLLTIGDLTMRKARASFSANFIGCLGYEIQDNLGFANIQEGVSKAKEFGADIVVLCSSDEEYANLLQPFSEEMKAKLPNAWKILAGYPKDLIQKAESLGIDDFIHMKRNTIEFMEKAQSKWIGKS
ncbi:MAG: methylmalonyl-CoA mutase family protein [Leptospira sp.]|nr:methylmalonyl-CoA mutase family protein [Leptospira sp.]